MKSARTVTRQQRASLRRVFAMPLLLLLASLAGLVLGLTGDGLPDALSWGLLSLPIILTAIAFLRRS